MLEKKKKKKKKLNEKVNKDNSSLIKKTLTTGENAAVT